MLIDNRVRSFLILSYLALVSLVGLSELLSDFESVLWLSAFLLIYNLLEIWRLYTLRLGNFFINPMVFGSVLIFCVYYGGLSNFYLVEEGWIYVKEPARILNTERNWVKVFLVFANYSAVSMWMGYYWTGAQRFNSWLKETLNYRELFKATPPFNRMVLLLVIGVAVKIYLFSIGLYGRVVSSEFFEAGVGYKLGSQIRILSELLGLVLIVMGYLYFVMKDERYKWVFWFCFIVEVFFGFIYGARGPILIPFFVVFFFAYFSTNVIRWYYPVVFVMVLFFSFTMVNDFKQFALKKSFSRFKSGSPITLLNDFVENQNSKSKKNKHYGEVVEETISNSTNFLSEGAMAIRHKDLVGLKEKDIDFVSELLYAPVDAFVPRFLQSNKNAPTWGYWFKNNVLKYQKKLKWSMAMTLIGNLYFTGGFVMVLVGFFAVGFLFRFSFISMENGIIGVIMSLSLFQVLVQEEIFANQCINALRYIFVFPWLLFFLFKRY